VRISAIESTNPRPLTQTSTMYCIAFPGVWGFRSALS
jgi:hypothetical protein